MGLLVAGVFLRQLGLPDGQQQHRHRQHHDAGDHQKQGLVVHMVQPTGGLVRVQDHGDDQVQNAAHGPHEIDDGVGLGPQRLGSYIGHQGHGGGAVNAHGHQQHQQHPNEQGQLPGSGDGGVAVVNEGQQVHQHRRQNGAHQDVGGAPAQAAAAFVGQGAEQGQQEQGQHVVRSHQQTGNGLAQVEGILVGKNFGNDAVVHLPEGGDGQKRQTDEHGAFVVQLQGIHLFFISWNHCSRVFQKRKEIFCQILPRQTEPPCSAR